MVLASWHVQGIHCYAGERDYAQELFTLRPCHLLAVALLSLIAVTAAPAQEPAYRNTNLPAEERARALVGRMTLDEKASQLEDWAPAIP